MSEEVPSAYKPRSALGDVTNQIGKRGFSVFSSPCVQSGDGCKNDEGVLFAKKECIRVDNSHKENIQKEIEINLLKGKTVATLSKISCETKDGDVMKDSCISTQLTQNTSKEKVENSLEMDDGDDTCVDNLCSGKDEFLDYSKLPESQESRCGLERCNGQKGDGFSSMCMDSIKACPCSFCMKAAYLWSDLHYQDMKGRIAAIKKSQKDASILVHKNSQNGGTGNSEKLSNMECDLTGRWMSLFLQMEDMFVCEGTQLETSLSILKEVRDNCKADTEEQ